MPTRFVILHHRLAESEHWDLMLEVGETLATWQLPREPEGDFGLPMPAVRIGDHRKTYLSYEGSISGNRGTVCRLHQGTADIVEYTDKRCRVRLQGTRLNGDLVLEQVSGKNWTLRKA